MIDRLFPSFMHGVSWVGHLFLPGPTFLCDLSHACAHTHQSSLLLTHTHSPTHTHTPPLSRTLTLGIGGAPLCGNMNENMHWLADYVFGLDSTHTHLHTHVRLNKLWEGVPLSIQQGRACPGRHTCVSQGETSLSGWRAHLWRVEHDICGPVKPLLFEGEL